MAYDHIAATAAAASCRYREHWAAAAASGAHAVSITSWNEWGEGTQIEPCQPWTDPDTGTPYKDYGTGGPWLYLNITQQAASSFIQAWHDKEGVQGVGGGEGVVAAGEAAVHDGGVETGTADHMEL